MKPIFTVPFGVMRLKRGDGPEESFLVREWETRKTTLREVTVVRLVDQDSREITVTFDLGWET